MMNESSKTANFAPTKRFFVNMITRDIHLEDAIIDLLDNCVDGFTRNLKETHSNKEDYEGYWAEIKFDKDSFVISDNCGGIPPDQIEYAFRLGKPEDAQENDINTVGIYGIGMKRAIFKLGRNCILSSNHEEYAFDLAIDNEWIQDEDNWEIDIEEREASGEEENGVTAIITELNDGVRNLFSSGSFQNELANRIIGSYSHIMSKGFRVKLNGNELKPKITELKFNRPGESSEFIAPYIYEATLDEVDVSLKVGFYRAIPTDEEVAEDLEGKNKSENAGWTIICNDRIVLYKDKSAVTGWGVSGVPKYHTQFIAIAGQVEFRSRYANKLPITTTKTGIDGNSELYLVVRDKMTEGMKIFTDWTNKWKGELLEEGKKFLNESKTEDPKEDIIFKPEEDEWIHVNNKKNERKFIPPLPTAPRKSTTRRVSFSRELEEIESVSEHLFGDKKYAPSQVGNACFQRVLEESR